MQRSPDRPLNLVVEQADVHDHAPEGGTLRPPDHAVGDVAHELLVGHNLGEGAGGEQDCRSPHSGPLTDRRPITPGEQPPDESTGPGPERRHGPELHHNGANLPGTFWACRTYFERVGKTTEGFTRWPTQQELLTLRAECFHRATDGFAADLAQQALLDHLVQFQPHT